ncbi:polysaccharide pyruvyl transferase family protein [Acinetobacter lwoffii]|uniref:polysaccharide pyruvyl transferase family protein n=1 Tax=Acinetobacter lwoffii TaxID=28090 RepID=UPI0035BC3424|nr:hypothetical protein ABEDC_0085 [Acinetobacter lwoffii]
MKKFYLSGHRTLKNKGCEALVRSTAGLINMYYGKGNVCIYVPSNNIQEDKIQFPDYEEYGIEFVEAYLPKIASLWVNFQMLPIPFIKNIKWPFKIEQRLWNIIDSVDAVFAIGGDNYSLDYKIPSLIVAIDSIPMQLNKPIFLWGGSVGPFSTMPTYVPFIKRHLEKFKFIGVRESQTFNYLTNNLMLKNVISMADPAFNLIPEKIETEVFFKDNEKKVLGFNISPLIERFNKGDFVLINEVESFLEKVILEYDLNVILIPHVTISGNNDYEYMYKIFNNLNVKYADRIVIASEKYNAAQIKYLMKHIDYFIGARTHSTIAAMSSYVPTISISYSIKAIGINEDIFGTRDVLIATSEVSCINLIKKLNYLIENYDFLKAQLFKVVPELQKSSQNTMIRMLEGLEK